jgi:hypothetical protein
VVRQNHGGKSSTQRKYVDEGGLLSSCEKTSKILQHREVVDAEPSHRTSEAREFIQQELDHSILPQERQAVLETALRLVNQLPHPSGQPNAFKSLGTSEIDTSAICDAPPAELLYMMLPGMTPNLPIWLINLII